MDKSSSSHQSHPLIQLDHLLEEINQLRKSLLYSSSLPHIQHFDWNLVQDLSDVSIRAEDIKQECRRTDELKKTDKNKNKNKNKNRYINESSGFTNFHIYKKIDSIREQEEKDEDQERQQLHEKLDKVRQDFVDIRHKYSQN